VLIASLSFLTYGLKTTDGLLVTIYGPTGWKNREREPLMYWLALGEWAFLALAGRRCFWRRSSCLTDTPPATNHPLPPLKTSDLRPALKGSFPARSQ
jgi:hypothetical protein